MTDALMLQLANNFRDKCRVFLNECLDELMQRFEEFQRHALEEMLRDSVAIMPSNPPIPAQEYPTVSAQLPHQEVDTDCPKLGPCVFPGLNFVLQPKQEGSPDVQSELTWGALPPPSSSQFEPEEPEEEGEGSGLGPISPAAPVPQSGRFRKRVAPKRRSSQLSASPPPLRRYTRTDFETLSVLSRILGANPGLSHAAINAELRRRLPGKRPLPDNRIGCLCRGLFFSLEPPLREAIGPPRPTFARWMLRQAGSANQRLLFVGEWLYNVFSRRQHAGASVGGRCEDISLLVALSPDRGVELHRLGRGPANAASLAAFMQELVTSCCAPANQRSALVLDARLAAHASLVARASQRAVQVAPEGPGPALTPMPAAKEEWKVGMLRRLRSQSVQSLLRDMQQGPSRGTRAAAELQSQVLRQHGEAILKSGVSVWLVARAHEAALQICSLEAREGERE